MKKSKKNKTFENLDKDIEELILDFKDKDFSKKRVKNIHNKILITLNLKSVEDTKYYDFKIFKDFVKSKKNKILQNNSNTNNILIEEENNQLSFKKNKNINKEFIENIQSLILYLDNRIKILEGKHISNNSKNKSLSLDDDINKEDNKNVKLEDDKNDDKTSSKKNEVSKKDNDSISQDDIKKPVGIKINIDTNSTNDYELKKADKSKFI